MIKEAAFQHDLTELTEIKKEKREILFLL